MLLEKIWNTYKEGKFAHILLLIFQCFSSRPTCIHVCVSYAKTLKSWCRGCDGGLSLSRDLPSFQGAELYCPGQKAHKVCFLDALVEKISGVNWLWQLDASCEFCRLMLGSSILRVLVPTATELGMEIVSGCSCSSVHCLLHGCPEEGQ